MEIKNPAQTGNNQQYEAQICHDLNHTNKTCHFDLATAIWESGNLLSFDHTDNQSHQIFFNNSMGGVDQAPTAIPLA